MVAGTGRPHLRSRPLVQVVACIMPETLAHARRRESHRVAWLRNGGALARIMAIVRRYLRRHQVSQQGHPVSDDPAPTCRTSDRPIWRPVPVRPRLPQTGVSERRPAQSAPTH